MCEVDCLSESAVSRIGSNTNCDSATVMLRKEAEEGTGNGLALQRRVFEQNERHVNGGLKLKDEAELKRQRGVACDLVKGMATSILEGKDLVNTSLPIYLFEPRSLLERLTDIFAYAPRYLPKAAHTDDPVERLKLVVAFAISGLHLLTTIRKPFNPILGETYEAHFCDGTDVVCEQTTHHPPASNWEMIPPDRSFHYWGYNMWSASYRGNTIKGYQKGPHNIDFLDGSRITWSLPDVLLKGVMWGERIMEFCGSMTFSDDTNHLRCDVEFNPEGGGFLRGLFSKPKQLADYFRGEIYRTANKKKLDQDVICQVEGSWLSHLDIGNERLWEIKMVPNGVVPEENPLPSDCRFRQDLIAVKNQDFERGKEYPGTRKFKCMLEEKQRSEEKMRKEGDAKRHNASKKSRK